MGADTPPKFLAEFVELRLTSGVGYSFFAKSLATRARFPVPNLHLKNIFTFFRKGVDF
jgi:hypothetical protein